MPWSIIVAGVAGAMAGAIAAIATKEKSGQLRIAIMAILFVPLNWAGQRYVAKPLIVDQELREVPAFVAIKKHEPATYAAMKGELVSAMQEGANTNAILLRIHDLTASLAQKYMSRCSDQALVRYVRVTMDEVDQLSKRNPDAAFGMLFPEPGKFVDIRPFVDNATEREDSAALADVISSGAGQPVHADSSPRANELLSETARQLAAEDGADAVKLIANPRAPGVDKRQVCVAVSRLYRKVLALPEADAALVLRTMLGSAGA